MICHRGRVKHLKKVNYYSHITHQSSLKNTTIVVLTEIALPKRSTGLVRLKSSHGSNCLLATSTPAIKLGSWTVI